MRSIGGIEAPFKAELEGYTWYARMERI